MKKSIIFLALFMAIVFAFTACSGGKQPAQESDQETTTPLAESEEPAGDDEEEPAAEVPDASDLEPYEIVYYMYSTKASDQDKVIEEAINEIIQPKFNATIDFVMISGGD